MSAKDLFVRLGLDSANFQSGLSQSIGGLTSLTKTAGIAGAAIVGMASTAGVAAYALAKTTANTGDQFQKMALRVGVSTEKLSALAHAAALSGSDIGTVETGLRLLSKKMQDADMGLQAAKQSFQGLGIATKDASGNLRASDEVMMEVADKLASMEDQTRATAIAQELFGRSGTALLPMLKSGSAGIKEMTDEAAALGIVWSQDDADAAALLNDNVDRLTRSMQGTKDVVGKSLIPVFSDLADAGQEVGKQIVAWTNANRDLIQQNVTSFVLTLADGLLSLSGVVIDLPVHWAALGVSMNRIISAFLDMAVAEAQVERFLWQILKVTNLINPFDWVGLTDVGGYIEGNIAAGDRWIANLNGIRAAADDDIGRLNQNLFDAQDNSNKLRDLLGRVRSKLDDVGKSSSAPAKAVGAFWESAAKGADSATGSTEKFTYSLPTAGNAVKEVSKEVQAFAAATGKSFSDAEKIIQAAIKDAGEVAKDSWQQQAEDRYEIQSRSLDALIEVESVTAEDIRNKWIDEQAEMLMASGNFFAGVKAGWLESQRDVQTWADVGKSAFTSAVGDMSTFFGRSFKGVLQGDINEIGAAFSSMVDSMLTAWVDLIGQMIAQWAAAEIASLFNIDVGSLGNAVTSAIGSSSSGSAVSAIGSAISGATSSSGGGGAAVGVGAGLVAGAGAASGIAAGAGATGAVGAAAGAGSMLTAASPEMAALAATNPWIAAAMVAGTLFLGTGALDSVFEGIGDTIGSLFGGGGSWEMDPFAKELWATAINLKGHGGAVTAINDLWDRVYGGTAYDNDYLRPAESEIGALLQQVVVGIGGKPAGQVNPGYMGIIEDWLAELVGGSVYSGIVPADGPGWNPYLPEEAPAPAGGWDFSEKSYAVGTPYVPETGLAFLHQGERVVTAQDNAEMSDLIKGLSAAQSMGEIHVHFHGDVYDGERTIEIIDAGLKRLDRRLH